MPLTDATESVALLGPTNTGKTHRAVERMLEHDSGIIGLPLRLLAREVYDRVSSRVGRDRVALLTGEEKRIPKRPDYWVCTTEAMPLSCDVDFVAVDEVQLATHPERGHVFTDRLLHARGSRETWFMGSAAMREIMLRLVPAAKHREHPRLSRLSFAGASKLGKLPPRSAVVAFSMPELYRLAGSLRALRGGAAVVLGALSPRARNAQVAMFQAGEVDYLVASDAVGMGLNLDVGHVAFASLRKFDGQHSRGLNEAEIGQIAGRAGRYLQDGTFGTLAPLELGSELAERIELHRAEPVRRVRFRNSQLDFSSPTALFDSLAVPPPAAHLVAAPTGLDVASLRTLLEDPQVAARARRGPALELLWRVCETPDFRQILFEVHVGLLRELFLALSDGPLCDDFLSLQTQQLSEHQGDVESVMARIAQLRTWAFVVHRAGWAERAEAWQARLAELEDGLSDALHAALVAKFVERTARVRTPKNRRPQRAPATAPFEPTDDAREVDPHHPFARLSRLRARIQSPPQAPSVSPESRWQELVDAPHAAFTLDASGTIAAGNLRLGQLARGPALTLPEIRLEQLAELPAGARQRLERRLLAFARDSVGRLLEPLGQLRRSERAPLRAIAYQLEQGLGTAALRELAKTLELLSEADRAVLNQSPVRKGRLGVFVPALCSRPALEQRLSLVRAFEPNASLPPVGRPHFEAQLLQERTWLSLGYVRLGARAFRHDLAERAAARLVAGEHEQQALACLALPKRCWRGVAAELEAALAQHG